MGCGDIDTIQEGHTSGTAKGPVDMHNRPTSPLLDLEPLAAQFDDCVLSEETPTSSLNGSSDAADQSREIPNSYKFIMSGDVEDANALRSHNRRRISHPLPSKIPFIGSLVLPDTIPHGGISPFAQSTSPTVDNGAYIRMPNKQLQIHQSRDTLDQQYPLPPEKGSSPSKVPWKADTAAIPQPVHLRDLTQLETPKKRDRTIIPFRSGDWVVGKTIGAGKIGKVKMVKNSHTGAKAVCKIIPRGSRDDNGQSRAERERADHLQEVQTAREAGLVTLLDHPYICSLLDIVRTTYHWYLLCEYIEGGSIVDYLNSHGRLKENKARKMSRQFLSAVDYCHRNNVVHRDLRTENILLTSAGDIKLIDFGDANLFSPRERQLKKICGTRHFAAPEVQEGQKYTGPEADVWSFGIILYTLVCAKLPFDDQSLPQLLAKIKRGVVDYEKFLSPDCKRLLSRILVPDPKQRATLGEVMRHPWIMKGYSAPPENYLPQRELLALPLDKDVIRAMTGSDLGPPEVIESMLSEVIERKQYQQGLRKLQKQEEPAWELPQSKAPEKRRIFDFYKRHTTGKDVQNSSAASSEEVLWADGPLDAYQPLTSIYYLVREKQEGDRVAAKRNAT